MKTTVDSATPPTERFRWLDRTGGAQATGFEAAFTGLHEAVLQLATLAWLLPLREKPGRATA